MPPSLTFDESAAEFVLEAFDRELDSEGYIVDPETGDRVTTPNGEEVHRDEFSGLEEGSILYLDDDFMSLVDHVKRQRDE